MDFKKGDRVIVTDLRTGELRNGVVINPPPANSQYMNVKYDTGQTVRVGKGFVKVE